MSFIQEHKYISEQSYFDCRLTGIITDIEPLIEAGRKLVKMATEKKCYRYLNDMRDSEFRVPFAEVIRLVATHSQNGLGLGWKRALLVKEMDAPLLLYEIATVNRDSNIRIFTKREEALNWLLSGDKP